MLKLIKEIREETGAGVVDIKKALEEANGEKEKALEILREKGLKKADKKADRVAGEGAIVSYIHADGKSGTLVKVLCETDFVAKNEEFLALANDIAMQIVAMNPEVILPEEVTEGMIKEELSDGEELTDDKRKEIISTKALYAQSFIKNPEVTVEELIKEKIATIGENIKVAEFVKFDI